MAASDGWFAAVGTEFVVSLAVGTVRALFPLKRYYQYASRSVYDVFPNGDFMMLGYLVDSVPARMPMIMRLNWAAGINTASEKRQ